MLRTVSGTEDAAQEGAAAPLQGAFEVNPVAELVADIVEATGLLPADKIHYPQRNGRGAEG